MRIWSISGLLSIVLLQNKSVGDSQKNVTSCRDFEFSCHDDGRCILDSWKCDGDTDCQDGSDETACLQVCLMFLCKNNKCIRQSWICDGIDDCGDGSDEMKCTEPKFDRLKKTWRCPKNYFDCGGGLNCIPMSKVCDNRHNCADNSDENCDSSICKDMNCSQLCVNNRCFCHDGFILETDERTCSDVDECATGDNLCSQFCTNTHGSYNCSCDPTYKQNKNRCNAKGPDPILIYSSGSTIQSIHLHSHVHSTIIENLTNIIGLASDYREKRIYFTVSDVSYSEKAILSVTFNGGDVKTQIKAGLQESVDIAIDWLSRNLYFIDSGAKHIAACSMLKDNCHIIVNKIMYTPREIELDVVNRYVFWTDWGRNSYIGRSWLDGSYVEMFVSTSIVLPIGLAIDHIAGFLYWSDAHLQKIESIGLNGQNRRVVFDDDIILHPHSMAVFENTLFWTDWRRHTVEACDKKTGKNHVTLVKEINELMAVHIIHPLQQIPRNNPCQYNKCSHQCLLKTQNISVCVCPAGFCLSTNNLTCQENKAATFILFAYGDKLAKFHPLAIGRNILIELKPQTQLFDITAITSDGKNRVVYIADSRKKMILALDLNTMATKTLVSTHISYIRDMALDKQGKNMYWIDATHKTVEILSLRTNRRMILVKLDYYPSAITLSTKYGILFVAKDGIDSYVEKMNMDGTQRLVFIRLPYSSLSTAVTYANNTGVFWKHPLNENVYFFSFREYWMSHSYIYNITVKMSKPASLIQLSERFYWTEIESSNIFWTTHIENPNTLIISTFYRHHNGYVPKLDILNSEIDEFSDNRRINECASNLCSHLCLFTPTSFTCACATDFVLQPDGTCEDSKLNKCLPNLFLCLDNIRCILPENVCDGDNDCIDGSDEYNCTIICENKFKCEDSTKCISNYWLCDGQNDCADASDESSTICDNITCNAAEFKCNSGQCIFQMHVCDGDRDCFDNSDEESCQNNTCSTDQFRCSGGMCINKNWVCDDEIDCPNKDDENAENCVKNVMCKLDEFTCNNSMCISISFKCNGIDECGDNSDENMCTDNVPTSCQYDMFRCNHSNKCIPFQSKCDKVQDCPDGEDEFDCQTCPTLFFQCKSQICISNSWVCDRDKDCIDGDDEISCNEPTTPEITPLETCPQDYFRCNSGDCIHMVQLCNYYPDCPDGSDEKAQCFLDCMNQNGLCEQKCNSKRIGVECSCYVGYRLADDNKTCLDIDECTSNPCDQQCINTIGSFLCLCFDGYRLHHDGISCKAEGISPKLLLMSSNEVIVISVDHKNFSIQVANIKMQNFDFDFENAFIYLSTSSGIHRSTMKSNGENKVELIHSTSNSCSKIAIDWITHNMYYIESDNTINVFSLNSLQMVAVTIINSSQQNITSIALNPNEKILFWSVKSNSFYDEGRIYRSWLDGSSQKIIAKGKVINPNNLVLDFVAKRIYWTDHFLNCIKSCTYDGHDKRLVMHSLVKILSLTLFEDSIYWIDFWVEQPLLVKCNKKNCKDVKIVMNSMFGSDLKIYQNVRQPKNSENICEENLCKHVCVPNNQSFTCLYSENSNDESKKSTMNNLLETTISTNDQANNESKNSNLSLTIGLTISILIILLLIVGAIYYLYIRKARSGQWNCRTRRYIILPNVIWTRSSQSE